MDEIDEILSQSNEDQDMDLIKQSCEELRKRFDTVQIFTTRHSDDDGGTVNCVWGSGNWFARYGLTRQWMLKEELPKNISKE